MTRSWITRKLMSLGTCAFMITFCSGCPLLQPNPVDATPDTVPGAPGATATPQLPNTAFTEGTEPVATWPVFAIISAVALAILLGQIVVIRRRLAAVRE